MKNDSFTIYPLLAKVGHKIQGDKRTQAETLWKHFYDDDIETYELNRLSSVQNIMSDSEINDLVMLTEIRKYSLDYDSKRVVCGNGNTKPHNTIDDFIRHRTVSNTLRTKKNKRATPELVDFYQVRSKQNVRKRGNNKEDCIRHVLRALTQNVNPFSSKHTYVETSIKLKAFNVTVNHLKNARRSPFNANVIFNNSANRTLIRKMLKALGYESSNNYQEWLDLLIHKGVSNSVSMYE